MGKEVINKSKAAAGEEVGLVEVAHQLLIGVRTRAKTQALRGLLHHNSATPPPPGEGSYLQLRSRRLQKPLNLPCQTKRNPISRISNTSKSSRPTPDSRTTTTTTSNSKVIGSLNSRSIGFGSTASFNCLGIESESRVEGVRKTEGAEERNINLRVGPVEASSFYVYENVLEFEGCTTRLISDRRRTCRESTPSSSSRRMRRRSRLGMPTSNEMDRFFLGPEQQQQQSQFMEK